MKTGSKLSMFFLVLSLAGIACNVFTRGFGLFQPDNADNPGSQNSNNNDPDQAQVGMGIEEVQPTIEESHAYLTSTNDLFVIGMVKNTGSETIDFININITVSLRDEAGTLISSESSYAYREILEPAMRSPFKVSFFEVPDGWTNYDIQVEAELNEYWESYTDFEILSDNGFQNDFGDYEITGELRNSGSETANVIVVIAAFYDASGSLVGTEFGLTDLDLDPLEPGGMASFTVTLFSIFAMQDGPEVASYELWVQGYVEE